MPFIHSVLIRKTQLWFSSLLFIALLSSAYALPVLERSETKEVRQKSGALLYSQKQTGRPLHGQVKVKRGSTISSCIYKAGFRDGTCQYHKKGGLLTKVEVFAGGLRKSETRYHRDGKQIKQLTSYDPVTRKKHGVFASYSDKGVHLMKGVYVAGERNGRWISRTDENKLRQQVDFKNGKKHGVSLKYNTKGQLQYKTHFANGKRHGAYAYYSGEANGGKMPVSEQGNYQHDSKHQTWTRYHSDSNVVQSKINYEAGISLESRYYRADGTLSEYQKRNKDGATLLIESYYRNGKLEERRTFTHANGMRSEKRESWKQDGSKKK